MADYVRHRTDEHASVVGSLQQESRNAQNGLQIEANVKRRAGVTGHAQSTRCTTSVAATSTKGYSMYYSSGNYEAFARPRKPQGVENKTAWFVGSGLAALAGAAFLIRDGQMPGKRSPSSSSAVGRRCTGRNQGSGERFRDSRWARDGKHFECLWECFRSIPSLEIEGASRARRVLLARQGRPQPIVAASDTELRRGRAPRRRSLTLSKQARRTSSRSFWPPTKDLGIKRIDEVFGARTFGQQHVALLAHHVRFRGVAFGLGDEAVPSPLRPPFRGWPDLSTLKFTKYNQYESLVLPLVDALNWKG